MVRCACSGRSARVRPASRDRHGVGAPGCSDPGLATATARGLGPPPVGFSCFFVGARASGSDGGGSMQLRKVGVLAFAIAAVCAGVMPAAAQITTGNIGGTVQDNQGGVIPGATVVLISESRNTRSAPVVTNETGAYVFPNVTPDVYTVEVTMDAFKTVKRTGIRVSGGDRVGVPAVVLEAGGVAETVNVTAESLLVQSQSAERSFAVSIEQIEGLPIQRQSFTSLLAFAPGVKINGSGSTGFE